MFGLGLVPRKENEEGGVSVGDAMVEGIWTAWR